MLATLGLAGSQDLLLFMSAVLVLNVTPGVDFALTISRTLQGGPRAGVAAALGIATGCALHALAAAFGLAALLALSGTAFTLLKWLGAAYLLWLAWGMARSAWRGDAGPAPQRAAKRSRWADFRSGLLTNLLNPKIALFFLAFLPQFIAVQAPHKTLAFLALGAVFVLQGLLFLCLLVLVAHRLRGLGHSAATGRWLNGLGAALFGALAVRLVAVRP